jgi:hypothetical protein
MNRKKITSIVCIIAALAIACVGAYAYYNGHTAPKVNAFNLVGGERDVRKGEIIEPNWDADNAVDMVPTQTIPKDPQFQSGVDYDAYAFMKVEMPQAQASLELEEDYSYQDAFTYEVNDGWVLLGEKPSNASGSDHVYLYMYGTDASTPTILPARGLTTALFDEITVPDFVRCVATSNTLDVEGFTEQSAGVPLATAIADAMTWARIQ